MRRVLPLPVAVLKRSALAGAAAVLWASGCTGHAHRQDDFTGGADVGSLTITVHDPSGQRQASMYCGNTSHATGYLTQGAALTAACVTATISFTISDYIEDGKLPPKKRCLGPIEPVGAWLHLQGTWDRKRVNRTLTVRTACEATMWRWLGPLREPRDQPLIPEKAGS
jgi:hypothetical protein